MDIIYQQLKEFGIKASQTCELRVPDSSRKAIAIEINRLNRYELWDHFKNLVDKTGLQPLVTATWSGVQDGWRSSIESEDLFMRFPFKHIAGDLPINPDAILDRSMSFDIENILEQHNRNYSEKLVDQIGYSIDSIQRDFNKAPTEQEILTAMGQGEINNYFELNKWLFGWQLQEIGLSRLKNQDNSFLQWYEPSGQVEALLLLPIKKSYESLAYIHWFGAEAVTSEGAIAILKKWNSKFGAELVAHYGTMLHITVSHPPTDPAKAFELAMEQEALAPCTTVLSGASLPELAVALIGRNNWFIHERP